MIVVTGATGKLGAAIIESLLEGTSAADVVASVREPGKAHALVALGVDVRQGDFDRPDTLVRSFDGADRLLLISASGIDHEGRAAQHRRAIRAAVEAGVGHVFYTSLLPGDGSVAYVMKAHLDTEADLRSSGLAFTILRNGAYAEGWRLYLGDVSGGEAVVPGDGPVSWVSRSDLADGTARLLLGAGHAGETRNLTGPGAIDLKGTAGILGRVRARPIVRRIVPVEDYVSRAVAAGKTEEFAREWATTYFGLERGEFGKVDPFLGALVGRPLRTLEEVLAQAAHD
ncbi:SDR family oxidoreductase [Frigoriglobus tundricola]|uniref:NAD(P)-binding domain-containing protein n=1 Tax=Frigoriglobus tundricola TaxID=2774151 RepID=A0A6M5YWE0_9BACT|nr:SDR family oxidoreductase [Frigoriglobus tundricola]QJW98345.1 hypothetical protein FTUN_5933 [Frigoriglobus tundricola]